LIDIHVLLPRKEILDGLSGFRRTEPLDKGIVLDCHAIQKFLLLALLQKRL
jgi:hypothetical protein